MVKLGPRHCLVWVVIPFSQWGLKVFLLFTYTLPIIYSNTYKYSSDTRFLKGIPRMSNNMFVLRSLNKTRQNISMKILNVPELSVSELVPIISDNSTHKYLRPTSLFLKVFSSRKLIRFPENKLEGEKNHDSMLRSAQFLRQTFQFNHGCIAR